MASSGPLGRLPSPPDDRDDDNEDDEDDDRPERDAEDRRREEPERPPSAERRLGPDPEGAVDTDRRHLGSHGGPAEGAGPHKPSVDGRIVVIWMRSYADRGEGHTNEKSLGCVAVTTLNKPGPGLWGMT